MAARAYSADPYTEDARQLLGRLFGIDFDAANDIEARRWCDEYARMFQPDWFVGGCRLMLMTWDSTEAPTAPEARRIAANATAAAPAMVRSGIEAQLHVLVAGVLARLGQTADAERLLDSVRTAVAGNRAVAVEPYGTELLQIEAGVRVRLGQRETAITLLNEYLKRKPGLGDWLLRSRRFRELPATRLQRDIDR
jgi:hypothetical protein